MAAIVILCNIFRAWTIYLCMDSIKFLLEAPGASILWGATILWQHADPFGIASIRWGASNRDITVCNVLFFNDKISKLNVPPQKFEDMT